jgi:hypothetical protein
MSEVSLENGGVIVKLHMEEALKIDQLKGLMVRYGWDDGIKKAVEVLFVDIEKQVGKEIQEALHRSVLDGTISFDRKDIP